MSFKMDRVHVWSCEAPDEPGGIASKLKALAEAGVNLEYVYTTRLLNKPGMGMLFVAPIVGAEQLRTARAIGMKETSEPIVMHLTGDNGAGLAHRLTQEWAKAGINLHGTVLTVVGSKFVGYVTFDSVEDANRAATILAELGIERPMLVGAGANGRH